MKPRRRCCQPFPLFSTPHQRINLHITSILTMLLCISKHICIFSPSEQTKIFSYTLIQRRLFFLPDCRIKFVSPICLQFQSFQEAIFVRMTRNYNSFFGVVRELSKFMIWCLVALSKLLVSPADSFLDFTDLLSSTLSLCWTHLMFCSNPL